MLPGLVLTRNARIGQPTSEQHLRRHALATTEFPQTVNGHPVNNIPIVSRSHNPPYCLGTLAWKGFYDQQNRSHAVSPL